jgi:hypothetical protein
LKGENIRSNTGNFPFIFLDKKGRMLQKLKKRSAWIEHSGILLFFLALSLALTWPLARDFTSALTGHNDALHFVWTLWHTRQALLGREPLFSTKLLYYPHGASLVTNAGGPLYGVFAFPFWSLGPEAAYNAALLIGFTLSGYCMYLLARSLFLPRAGPTGSSCSLAAG